MAGSLSLALWTSNDEFGSYEVDESLANSTIADHLAMYYRTERNEALGLRPIHSRKMRAERLRAEPGQSPDAVLGDGLEPATGAAAGHHSSDYADQRRVSVAGYG